MSQAPMRFVLANAVRVFAGAERFVLDAALGLRDRGHAVTVQAYPSAPLACKAAAAGLPVWPVATRADFAPWTVTGLAARLRKTRPHVVLTAYEKDLRNVGLAARLASPDAFVLHSRECDVPIKNRPHHRWFYRRVADHVLVNSQATRTTTLTSAPWLAKDRVSVLYKGIDVAAYQRAAGIPWRHRLQVPDGHVLLGFAGQLVPRKRLDVLLRLLAGDELRSRPWTLAVAGTGPQQDSLKKLAAQLDLAARIRWCGWIEPLAPWLHALDVLVLPSLVEGFGYVLAEAAACSVPAVAMATSSVPEVVAHDETGLLAPPHDDPALARLLARMLEDSSLRHRLSAGGPRRVEQLFSLERMVEQLEELCRAGRSARLHAIS